MKGTTRILRAVVLAGAVSDLAADSAAATNLVKNAYFHSDVSSWTGRFTTLLRSPLDANDATTSGSLLVRNLGSSFASAEQCLPVTGGGSLFVFVRYRVPSGQGLPTLVPQRSSGSFASTDCSGPLLGIGGQQSLPVDVPDTWHAREGVFTVPAGARSFRVGFSVRERVGGGTFELLVDDVVVLPLGPCTPNETTLCLNDDRFLVAADWHLPDGRQGSGRAVELTEDTGYFWFFHEANVEEIVKVLDACAAFDRFWVFAAGLTNVQVITLVLDTQWGRLRIYASPQGPPFRPLQDTNAFGFCP